MIPQNIDPSLPARLKRSAFRSRFRLNPPEHALIARRGMPTIANHAAAILARNIVPAEGANDGRQTPMRGHPVFVAQHATATCCRTCIAKWHGIPSARALSHEEARNFVDLIMWWLQEQPVPSADAAQPADQLRLL